MANQVGPWRRKPDDVPGPKGPPWEMRSFPADSIKASGHRLAMKAGYKTATASASQNINPCLAEREVFI
jgi:hypothetical protein